MFFFVLLANTLNLLNLPFYMIDIVKGSGDSRCGAPRRDAQSSRPSEPVRTGTMDQPIFSFSGIGKVFFGVSVLKNIDLTIQPGHVLGLIGENGAGKSTLVNVMAGCFTRIPFATSRRSSVRAPRAARRAGSRHRFYPSGTQPIHQSLCSREHLH